MTAKRRHAAYSAAWLGTQVALYLMGAWTILAGIACYLRGPCPRPDDLHLHLIFGRLYSGIGVALVIAGRKVGRLAQSHLKQQE